ncbi:MAG: AAA domain-containing protein, partial [Desulfobacterales bacterium]|nr:AAA domain-containing protein [Desulfobacterales bacterium]
KCGSDIVGQSIHKLNMPEYTILKCLEGERIENTKQNLITKKGRFQYISTCKPIHDSLGKIIGAVEIAKDIHGIKKMAQTISEPAQISFSDIIGQNFAIREAISLAEKIAPMDTCVSVRGDSGTGKELFARAIHTASGRTGPFVPINCAALPEQLLESELFGYVGGAFTGGKKEGKAGLFEIAQNGAVFLDEIAEMPLGAQAKLLRLLQEQAVRRIGGSEEIPINARIITATNRNLENSVRDNLFRQDLYYRINVLPLHIPPLNQRLDDIEILIEHFLFRLSNKLGGKKKSLTPSAVDKMMKHDWPGNVRELKNVVERAAILCDREVIDVVDILFSHELNGAAGFPGVNLEGMDQNGPSLKERIGDYEKAIIIKALDHAKTIRKAARHLKLSHPALIKKMRKYNITREVKTVARGA